MHSEAVVALIFSISVSVAVLHHRHIPSFLLRTGVSAGIFTNSRVHRVVSQKQVFARLGPYMVLSSTA